MAKSKRQTHHNDAEPGAVLIPAMTRLQKDLKEAAISLTTAEARYLVTTYYRFQDQRKRADSQISEMTASGDPHETLSYFAEQWRVMERQLKGVLDVYSNSTELGRWARSIIGIGPVISAGLLAHIDITKAKTAGAIWKFAGLTPGQRKVKGKKRSWNADLKVIAWKIGDSFCKKQSHKDDIYGKLYAQRKEIEVANNEAGKFADQAAATLADTRYWRSKETRAVYESGKLPDGRIDLRARRWAVKLFLAHYHEVAWRLHYGTEPPNPYPIAFLGHVHKIDPPGVR